MWLIIGILLVWIIFLCFEVLGKDAEYLGTISSLKQEIERKNEQIAQLEKDIRHIKNQTKDEPEV